MTLNLKSRLKEKIEQIDDIKKEMLHVKAWDVDVEVRAMNGAERGRFIQSVVQKDGSFNLERLYPTLAILSVFDPETGEKAFSPDDRGWLASKSGEALQEICDVAMRINGLTQEALKEAKND